MNVNKIVDMMKSHCSVPGVSYRPSESFQPRANPPINLCGLHTPDSSFEPSPSWV